MVKRRIALRNVQNVTEGSTALIELPIGTRYHYVVLQYGYANGTNTIVGAGNNVSQIRVKVNGRVQRTFTGYELRDLNLLNGTAYDCLGLPNTAPGVSFPIYFAEPWRKDVKDQDALAWCSAWKGGSWDSFQIEVDLGTGGDTPTLVAYAVVDDFIPEKEQAICKVVRQAFAASGTQYDIATIDRRDWLQQITLYKDSGASLTPSKVTVRKDGVVLHELTATANTAVLTNHGMTPAASGRAAGTVAVAYDVVFDHDDLLGSAVPLDGARDFTITVEAATAMSGTTVALVQRIGSLE